LFALCALLAAWAGQTYAVWTAYDGKLSGLYFVGSDRAGNDQPPPGDAFIHPDTYGYDGQYYRLIARDPLLRTTDHRFLDEPRLRWRRILVPALAWAGALGNPDRVDETYRWTVLLLFAAGVAISCRLAVQLGFHAAWGLVFVLLPANLISLERLTVDGALATLTVLFAYGVLRDRRDLAYAAMALAPLARETGFALAAGWMLWSAWRRRAPGVGAAVFAVLPAVAWTGYVSGHAEGSGIDFLSPIPLSALAMRLIDLRLTLAGVLDHLALVGAAWAFFLSVRIMAEKPRPAHHWAIAVFAFGCSLLAYPAIWDETYAFGRILSPLMLLLVAARPTPWTLAPLALTLPRILAQLGTYLISRV